MLVEPWALMADQTNWCKEWYKRVHMHGACGTVHGCQAYLETFKMVYVN